MTSLPDPIGRAAAGLAPHPDAEPIELPTPRRTKETR